MQVNWVFWLRVSHKAAIKCRSRVNCSTRVKSVPRLPHLAVSHLKFSLYLTRDQCLATGFAFRFLTTWLISSSIVRATARVSNMEGRLQKSSLQTDTVTFTIFIVLEDSCHWIKPTFKGRSLHKGMDTRKQISLGIILVKILREKTCKHCHSLMCVMLLLFSCSVLSDCHPMGYRPPGSSVHGISQARILEWVAICFSRGPSQSRDQICVSCTGRQILYH